MGTMANIFGKSAVRGGQIPAIQAEIDPFRLRALPGEDVFFPVKRIDNSRIVRQQDPAARGECWSAVGAAGLLLMIGGSIVAPHVGSVLAGYRIESLKVEQQALRDQVRELEVKEASLMSDKRLNALADDRQLAKPAPSQTIHLENQAREGHFASVHPSRAQSGNNVR